MTMLIPKLSTNDILLFQVVVKWSIQKDWKCWHSSTLLTKKYSQTTISSSFRIFCLCNIVFDQCFVRGGFVTHWSLPFPLEMHNGDSKQRSYQNCFRPQTGACLFTHYFVTKKYRRHNIPYRKLSPLNHKQRFKKKITCFNKKYLFNKVLPYLSYCKDMAKPYYVKSVHRVKKNI